jgi:SAM-dependent methyltransferase
VSTDAKDLPSEADQAQFWDNWNEKWRVQDLDGFMQRQLDIALHWVRGLGPNASVLELGCGTGWLVRELHSRIGSRVTGIDLSPAAIEVAKQHCPSGRFFSGDFGSESVNGRYDAVVSADVIAHVPDQQKFADRVAQLLRPGGLFILMTQNPFVWNRSSRLSKKDDRQIRNWPPLGRIRGLLDNQFSVIHVSSIVPGGDQGVLKLVNSRLVAGSLRKLLGKQRATALYEDWLVGRELIVVGKRV